MELDQVVIKRLKDALGKNWTYPKLIASIKGKTMGCMVIDEYEETLFVFPVLGNNVPFIDMNLIMAKDWSVEFHTLHRVKITRMAENFWTCGCGEDFIHHKSFESCTKCNTVLDRYPNVEPHLADLLKWKFIVGE